MAGLIFDDVRRILLGLLFVIAFGWMAAQVMPGAVKDGDPAAQVASVQMAFGGERVIVPPHP